jgi:ribonuclease HI
MDSQKVKKSSIRIYTDGACQPNPGASGSGIAVYVNNTLDKLVYGKYIPLATNNIAELNALLWGITVAKEYIDHGYHDVELLTDSQYSIKCVSVWIESWLNSNWKDDTVKNRSLIENIYKLYKPIKNVLKLKYVKGHAGIEGNELADRMAIYAIRTKNEKFQSYAFDTSNIDVIFKIK